MIRRLDEDEHDLPEGPRGLRRPSEGGGGDGFLTVPQRVVDADGPIDLDDRVILFDHTAQIELDLPENAPQDFHIILKDLRGSCEDFDVIINAPLGTLIDGDTSYVVNVPYMSVQVASTGAGDFFVF